MPFLRFIWAIFMIKCSHPVGSVIHVCIMLYLYKFSVALQHTPPPKVFFLGGVGDEWVGRREERRRGRGGCREKKERRWWGEGEVVRRG